MAFRYEKKFERVTLGENWKLGEYDEVSSFTIGFRFFEEGISSEKTRLTLACNSLKNSSDGDNCLPWSQKA